MANDAVKWGPAPTSRWEDWARNVAWERPRALAVCLIAGAGIGALAAVLNPLVGIGLLAALGLVFVTLRRPTGRFWLLAGVIGLLPFGTIPKLGIQPTFLDAALGLVLVLAFLRLLDRNEEGVRTPLDLPILAYVMLCIVSFVSGSAYGVTGDTIKYFARVVFGILVYFALTNGLKNRWALRSFANALILSCVGAGLLADFFKLAGQDVTMRLLSALGPLGYPTGGDTLRFIATTNIWRATSTSTDPNIFGGLMMIGIVLLVGRFMGVLSSADDEPTAISPTPTHRAVLVTLPLLAIMVWALLLSYSRGAYVGAGAGIMFLGVLRYRKLLPLVAVAGVIAFVTLGGSDFGRHLVSGFLVEDKAAAMRLGEYKDAVNFISQYPILGVGFGTTPSGSAITPAIDIYVGVSNIYLLMALEIGLVGMLGFASVMVTLVVWAWQRYSRASAVGQAWIATSSAALVSAGVAGIADHYFFRFPHMIAMFWSLVALLAISVRLAEPRPELH